MATKLKQQIGFTFSETECLNKSDQDKYYNHINKKLLKLCPHVFFKDTPQFRNQYEGKKPSPIVFAVIICDGEEDCANIDYYKMYFGSQKLQDFCYIYKLNFNWLNCYSASIFFTDDRTEYMEKIENDKKKEKIENDKKMEEGIKKMKEDNMEEEKKMKEEAETKTYYVYEGLIEREFFDDYLVKDVSKQVLQKINKYWSDHDEPLEYKVFKFNCTETNYSECWLLDYDGGYLPLLKYDIHINSCYDLSRMNMDRESDEEDEDDCQELTLDEISEMMADNYKVTFKPTFIKYL